VLNGNHFILEVFKFEVIITFDVSCEEECYLDPRQLTSLFSSWSEIVQDQRLSILLSPFFEPPVSSVSSLDALIEPSTSSLSDNSAHCMQQAFQNLICICIDILVSGVASSDLQYLVNPLTSEILVIDFTEARILSSDIAQSKESLPFYDKQLVNNFLSELRSQFPAIIRSTAEEYLQHEMRNKLKPISAYSFLFEDV
jgi:hypothetical protein